MPGRRLALCFLFNVAVLSAHPFDARAQLPANAPWSTIESPHFRVTYERGLEQVARHAAASAERAHAALRYLVANPPPDVIDIVLADNVDFSNGYATPLPSNRIVIYAKSPLDVLELQYTRDWMQLVITHELAHIFHLDVSGSFGRVVRAIFGRVPATWPVFPVIGTPLWSLEGLAIGAETHIAGLGRLQGSYNEMIVRTAALEAEIDDIQRLNSTSPVWPGGSRVYIYGSLFMDYIARRFGPDAIPRLVRTTAGAIIPPPLWFSGIARDALGQSFQDLYAQWAQELEQRYAALATQLSVAGVTNTVKLTDHGRVAVYPRFSPDARSIAYASSDGRRNPRTTVIDAETGAVAWSKTRNEVAPSAWSTDSTLITSDLQYVDRFRIYSDLYMVQRGGRDRFTSRARLQEPDVSRSNRIIAIENGNGTNRLVLVDPSTGERRAINEFNNDVQWSGPRWAPDGQRIAVSRWRVGGRFDVVIIDTLGAVQMTVSDTVGINAGAAWSPDGQWVIFGSDRTGIPNLYAAELNVVSQDSAIRANGTAIRTNDSTIGTNGSAQMPRLRQITNLLTGAFYPDVSPDGRWIAFSAYHYDGFAIERVPFDPASWRDPQTPTITLLADQRTSYATQIRATEFNAAARAATTRADTVSSHAGPYRALKSMKPYFWLPLLETNAGDDYYGLFSFGDDLVQRHDWAASLAVAPGSGRTTGALAYSYRGLPSIRSLGMHPSVSFAVDRDWDEIERNDSIGYYIDEREDRAFMTLGLARSRWRSSTFLSLTGEYVWRSRLLFNAPANSRLINPEDDLIGIRAGASYSAYTRPAFAISPQNGVVLQLSARERWDRNARTVETNAGPRIIDGGYSEITTWNAAYLALPTGGFARQVLAARFSALLRDGPGASTTGIGGASGEGFGIAGVVDNIGGSSRLLPVRGFPADARRGTRAWTASAEYRAPLALVTRGVGPIFIDRLSASLFADAGHAWCDADTVFRACTSTSATGSPLLSAGAELAAFTSFFGAGVPLRFGVGFPIIGGSTPRAYVAIGSAF